MTTYSAFQGPAAGGGHVRIGEQNHNMRSASFDRRPTSQHPSRPLLVRKQESPKPEDRPSMWQRLLSLSFTLAIVGAVVLLWPARFGGATSLVMVAGTSMEPVYDFGDMVVARDGGRHDVGDVVVFAVPDGQAKGMLVIHRIIDIDPQGFFVTQGDNRDTRDHWQLTNDDIVGEPRLHIPKGGHVVWFLQQWVVLAALVGLLVVFLLWPDSTKTKQEDDEDDDDTDVPRDDAELDDTVAMEVPLDRHLDWHLDWHVEQSDDVTSLDGPTSWTDREIDHQAMADAVAWLDEQLDSMIPTTNR